MHTSLFSFCTSSGQWTVVVNCLLTVQWTDSGQWTVDSGRWTVDGGQWTVDSGQWTVDSEQWTVDSGQWTVDNEQWTSDNEGELVKETVSSTHLPEALVFHVHDGFWRKENINIQCSDTL